MGVCPALQTLGVRAVPSPLWVATVWRSEPRNRVSEPGRTRTGGLRRDWGHQCWDTQHQGQSWSLVPLTALNPPCDSHWSGCRGARTSKAAQFLGQGAHGTAGFILNPCFFGVSAPTPQPAGGCVGMSKDLGLNSLTLESWQWVYLGCIQAPPARWLCHWDGDNPHVEGTHRERELAPMQGCTPKPPCFPPCPNPPRSCLGPPWWWAGSHSVAELGTAVPWLWGVGTAPLQHPQSLLRVKLGFLQEAFVWVELPHPIPRDFGVPGLRVQPWEMWGQHVSVSLPMPAAHPGPHRPTLLFHD